MSMEYDTGLLRSHQLDTVTSMIHVMPLFTEDSHKICKEVSGQFKAVATSPPGKYTQYALNRSTSLRARPQVVAKRTFLPEAEPQPSSFF